VPEITIVPQAPSTIGSTLMRSWVTATGSADLIMESHRFVAVVLVSHNSGITV